MTSSRERRGARFLNARVGRLLAGNTVISCTTFLVSITTLWALVRFTGLGKYPAAALGFCLATSLHYVACRLWLYRGTARGVATGYAWFFLNAGVGLLITMALFAAFVEGAHINYLVARVLASVFAGLAIFLLNAVFTFEAV